MLDLRLWIAFSVLVVGCLAVDLRAGGHRHGRMTMRAAAIWFGVWVGVALAFAGAIALLRHPADPALGRRDALLFLTGYLVEKSLSVDNMFVFILVFAYFAVTDEDQPRVLKWGILGAVVFRAALIAAGAALVKRFDRVLYLFALLLLFAAWKMLTSRDERIAPERNPVLRLFRRFFPVVDRFEGHRFFIREPDGRRYATALLCVLIVIESTDVLFALDSIPAIFAITQDTFIIFTSNVFAILGLRSLFFLLAAIMPVFRFLKLGVAAILGFIAVKMLIHEAVAVPVAVSLSTIGGLLGASVLASVLVRPRRPAPEPAAPARPGESGPGLGGTVGAGTIVLPVAKPAGEERIP